MSILIHNEPVLEKMYKHFKDNGISSSFLKQKLDFETNYLYPHFLGTSVTIRNVGSLKLENSPIDYIHIIKKEEEVKCDYVMGSHVGMGLHKHTWWKLRFFLSFPEQINIGPLKIGTISIIKKGLFNSKIEDYYWNGYPKLTTLPPGIVNDNVVESLDSDSTLRDLMIKCLINERVITISKYSSENTSNRLKTNSKIVIEAKWRIKRELRLDKDTLDMYEKMAKIIKQTINNLKYHLTQ